MSAEALHGDQQGNASATVARRAVSPVTRGQRHDPASAHPTGGPSTDPGTTGDVAAPLDLLLTDAALGPTRRFFPGASGLRFTRALASQPRLLAACVGGLAGELGRVVAGTSQVAPSRRDRRFTDPAWTQNPFLRRVVQAYIATTTAAAAGLVGDVPLGWRDTERVRFVADNLLDLLAPSNNPLLSPVA